MHGKESDVFQLFECTHFTLIIAVANPENNLAERVHTHFKNRSGFPILVFRITKLPAEISFFNTYGIRKDAIFIVRPDSHIGFRSSRLDLQEIDDYFYRVVGMEYKE